MTTYGTNNPIGSPAPKDLYDNAENLDTAIHTGENTWVDRLGNTRTSWAGATGYQVLGDYAGAIEITERNQIVREGGEYWRLKGSVDLPYTTTGTWVGDDDARFVSVGDAVLRSELALDGGVFLVKDAVASVANVTELRALTGLVDGQVVRITDTGRAGLFRRNEADLSPALVLSSVASTSVDAGADTITSAGHGLINGNGVITVAPVNGLSANTVYYVITATTDTFQLSATYGGAAVDLTGSDPVTVKHLLDPQQGIYVISSGQSLTGSDGAWVRQYGQDVGYDLPVNILWFGAVADSTPSTPGTDNASIFSSANSAHKNIVIPEPLEGFYFGVSQWSLQRGSTVQGPGQYVLAIVGTTSDATLTGGGITDLKREITIKDLYIENSQGGDAADLEYCPDFNLVRIYFRSVGASAGRGLNLKNSERGSFSGHCRLGGNPALRMVKDCNGVTADNIVCSGGALGLAVDISGCQQVRMPLTIETSLEGVRIGDNTGDNETEGGFTSGIDLTGSYLESVGTPFKIGVGFAVNGVGLDNCWLNNGALADSDPFPVSSEVLKLGRVKSLSLKGGRWVAAGTEAAIGLIDSIAPSGSAPGQIETLDVDLTVFESVASLIDLSVITNAAYRATAAATNKIAVDDVGRGLGRRYEWVSPVLTANTSYGAVQLTKTLTNGGRVQSVELIEGDGGSMNSMRVQVGNSVAGLEIVDKTYGAVNPLYDDLGVTDGLIRPGSYLRFNLSAGSGAGQFRIRIVYTIDDS